MKMIKLFFYKIAIIGAIIFFSTFAYANKSLSIKIALLDNFTLEKYAQSYKDSYYAGIKTAIIAAKKKHVNIKFKNFTYGSNPIAILDAISSVKSWHPDVIIGPHYSNQFLLLKNHFKNILVLSPYSTDQAISNMPNNFYSLALPNSYLAKANYIFIQKNFPDRSVYNISQLDCKDCIDTTNNLIKIYAKKNKSVMIRGVTYLGDQVNTIDIAKLMEGYRKNSVIVLQPLNDLDANLLITIISKFLKTRNLVFIYNVDNWGSDKNFQKTVDKAIVHAQLFRIIPKIIDPKLKKYQIFSKYYQERFKERPKDAVSYTTYNCIMSVVDALRQFPKMNEGDMRALILSSYLAALKNHKNWYRFTTYVIYKHSKKHDILLGTISINEHY